MRWNDLFADLESQLEHELGAESAEARAEEERFRIGRLTLRDRIVRGPAELDLRLVDGERLMIRRLHVGKDWLSGEVQGAADRAEGIVPLGSIVSVAQRADSLAMTLDESPPAEEALAARLAIGFVLRDLSRRRVFVDLRGHGARTGTIDRVGRDHLDIARHEHGTSRAERNLTGIETVALAAICWIRLPG